jgi:flagellin-specific chaperone FliS
MYQSAYRSQEYRQQEVLGASPLHLVIMAYDLAIKACEQQDFEKAVKTISALRDALDFEYPEVSTGLFRIYQYCLDSLRQGDFSGVGNTLKDLREAWSTVEKKQFSASSSQARAASGRPGLSNVAG